MYIMPTELTSKAIYTSLSEYTKSYNEFELITIGSIFNILLQCTLIRNIYDIAITDIQR